MSFASEASKLLTNKYFLYFIAFLAVTNVMGYIVMNKINAVVFFALVCILMFNFSKNMTIVLIVALVATNLLMVNKSMREGMESGTTTSDSTTTDSDPATTDSTTDSTQETTNKNAIKSGVTAFKEAGGEVTPETKDKIEKRIDANATVKQAKDTVATAKATTTEDPTPSEEAFTPAGSGFSGKKRGAIGGPAKASRIDYSTTLEQAYDNLDKMLGSDGLNNLTADTEKLMAQQQKLFSAVNSMMPMIDKAQGMLQGLDMDKINSLVGMTDKIGNFAGVKGK
jgi:hypothetical protein